LTIEDDVTDRYGVYVDYANGTVGDTNTGLEWKVGPDRDMNWNEARAWVKSLEGDWRMPTMDELSTLYQEGEGYRNMTPLLKTTGWVVWSGEERGFYIAWGFDFFYGGAGAWDSRGPSLEYRAFAVRSRSEGLRHTAQRVNSRG